MVNGNFYFITLVSGRNIFKYAINTLCDQYIHFHFMSQFAGFNNTNGLSTQTVKPNHQYHGHILNNNIINNIYLKGFHFLRIDNFGAISNMTECDLSLWESY